MQPGRLTLDNPIFAGTLRRSSLETGYVKRELHPRTVQDVAYVRARPQVVAAARSHQSVAPAARLKIAPSEPLQTETAIKQKRTRRTPIQQVALYAMASVIFCLGLYIAYDGWQANHKVAAQVGQLQKQVASSAEGDGSSAVPSTEKPSDSAVRSYVVAPNLPRYLDIPKLGVHTRVMSMSVDSKNELQAPNNVHNAGWYNASAQPGQAGAMLVDGHSGIGNYRGIFHDIGTLTEGDTITITRGDGATFDYRVVKTETLDAGAVNMSNMLVSADTSKPGLNLITCAGDQIPGTYQLAQRTTVYAVLK